MAFLSYFASHHHLVAWFLSALSGHSESHSSTFLLMLLPVCEGVLSNCPSIDNAKAAKARMAVNVGCFAGVAKIQLKFKHSFKPKSQHMKSVDITFASDAPGFGQEGHRGPFSQAQDGFWRQGVP